MRQASSIWRAALSLVDARLVLGQIELAVLVFLLFLAWLRIPDASALDVAATVLLGLLIVALAGAGESFVILRLCGRKRSARHMALGALLIVVAIALWFGWSALIEHVRGNDYQRAGYYNSQLPHRLRYFFTYERIILWLGWMWNTLTWIDAGILTLGVVCGTAAEHPLRAVAIALRSVTFWLTLLICTLAAIWVTSSLSDWTPGHGLRLETFSLLARLSVTVLFDAIVFSLLLAVSAACCRAAATDATQLNPAGTPDRSQPTTDGNP